MPLLHEKEDISNIKESQISCITCKKTSRNAPVISCDICNIWKCKDCCSINEKLIELALTSKSKLNYVCEDCQQEAPKIRDLMKISQRQDKMEENIRDMQETLNVHTTAIQETQENTVDFEERLKTVEKIIKDNKLSEYSEEYPPLVLLSEKVKSQEQHTSKFDNAFQKQVEDKEEEARKASKVLNLIIYGIPEDGINEKEQMKQDFLTLKEIYKDKVEIETTSITHIMRIGKKAENKLRPIKITCANAEIRKDILTQNKYLRIEGDSFKMCNCKINPGKHLHINVTTDKTKKEREEESQLLNELQTRRNAGEDVTIKRGKIMKRSDVKKVYARWAEICQNV